MPQKYTFCGVHAGNSHTSSPDMYMMAWPHAKFNSALPSPYLLDLYMSS